MSKRTGQKSGRLGVGWLNRNAEGGIDSITVAIDFPSEMKADPDIVWTLFPTEFNPNAKPKDT